MPAEKMYERRHPQQQARTQGSTDTGTNTQASLPRTHTHSLSPAIRHSNSCSASHTLLCVAAPPPHTHTHQYRAINVCSCLFPGNHCARSRHIGRVSSSVAYSTRKHATTEIPTRDSISIRGGGGGILAGALPAIIFVLCVYACEHRLCSCEQTSAKRLHDNKT